MLCPRDPNLLPADDVLVALAHRHRLQLGGVRTGRRLAHAERLKPKLAAGNLRQVLALLRLRPVPKHGAHRVHLRVARACIGAAAVDLLHDDRRFRHAKARPAVFFRNQRGEVTGVGQRLDEGGWILARVVELAPVAAGKCLAEIPDTVAQVLMLVMTHGAPIIPGVLWAASWRPWPT